ncbi:shikimate dehydrogenase family protein [Salegentibacter chungangensis]|uniref:Shikimate dehydrogenase family protein n=1 Tax=Salegentibacter chungangensis TaxID=1335724 RepID=A0ABW3NT41_9FLAO
MKIYGLIGQNIDYSFSRAYFSEKFEKHHITAVYRNFDLSKIEQIEEVFKNTPDLSGLNVTIPYKEAVIPYLNRLDTEAEEIGAVNTIKIEKDGSLTGYNTDHYGFYEAIKAYLQPQHKKALILGTGGASKAVAYALTNLGITYRFVSRKDGHHKFSYEQLNADILKEYTVIINCTPLGTHPDTERYPDLPIGYISEAHLIFDLIYNPLETTLMKKARERGATCLNGLNMLKLQAEKAWEIWNS